MTIKQMFVLTRWRHGNDVFVKPLWRSLSSFINGDNSHPVHGQRLQTYYSEGCLDDSTGITAVPLQLVYGSDLHNVPFRFIFHTCRSFWLCPSQTQCGVTRASYFEIFHLPRRLWSENSNFFGNYQNFSFMLISNVGHEPVHFCCSLCCLTCRFWKNGPK